MLEAGVWLVRRLEKMAGLAFNGTVKYRFANCVLDTDRHELRRDGEQVCVEPQVFDLLHLMLRTSGDLISQDTIMDEIWGGRIVSDSAISSRISAVRKAVGDNGRDQAVIKTVARRGFQLIAPVEVELTHENTTACQTARTDTRQTVRFLTSADGTGIAFATSGRGLRILRAGHFMTHLVQDWQSPIWRPYLEAIGERHTVVRYDQRGTGLSDRKLKDTRLEAHVADLKAVADAAGLDRFPLVATSQGVPIAIQFAANNPERVSSLILYGGYATGRALRNKALGGQETDPMPALIRAGWGKPDSGFMVAFTSLFCPTASRNEIANLAEIQSSSAAPENAVMIRNAIDRFDVAHLLAKVRTPTLVIHARNDAVHPVSQGQLIARSIPNAEFLQIESTNHVPLPSHPTFGEIIEATIAFLART